MSMSKGHDMSPRSHRLSGNHLNGPLVAHSHTLGSDYLNANRPRLGLLDRVMSTVASAKHKNQVMSTSTHYAIGAA